MSPRYCTIVVFLSVAIVNCAVRRSDDSESQGFNYESAEEQESPREFAFVDREDKRGLLDVGENRKRSKGNLGRIVNQPRNPTSIIELDALDPRKQAVSSSYSVVETSKGPNKLTVTRTDHHYEPEKVSYNARVESGSSPAGSFSHTSDVLEDDDEKEPQRNKFSNSKGRSNSENTAEKRNRSQKTQIKTEQKSKPSSPKNIKDIVEEHHSPLQEAGSSSGGIISDDLKDSGSFLSSNFGDGYEEGYDKEKHYDKERGKKFKEAHKSEAGEKAKQGYKKEEGYDKAEQEKRGKEQKKAVIKEEEGEKKAHVDQAKQFEEGYKGQHGEKGISTSKKGGHKKGHKKKGFHKVHHKDEFKKDEVFYDEEHDDVENEEHAHEKQEHGKEKGVKAKKGHIDEAYHEGHTEKKGIKDKGKHYEEASGHKSEAGKEEHQDHHSKFGKKAEAKEGEKHGHSEAGTSGGGFHEDDHFD